MFNFTTLTVLNNVVVNAKNALTKDTNVITDTDFIKIAGIDFRKDDINIDGGITLAYHTDEALAEVTFDMSKIDVTEKDQNCRIALYVTLSMNSQDSFYSNDLVYKGKPFYIEFMAKKGAAAADIAKGLKKNADKYLIFFTEEPLIEVSVNGGKVTFKAVNGYQQFRDATLQVYDPEAIKVDCCTNTGDYIDIVKGVPVKDNGTTPLNPEVEELAADEVGIKQGREAFGDYNWMIHNLRLQTYENTNPWAWTKHEQPTPGTTYDQMVIRITRDRDQVGGSVMGMRATSVTTHVFYINSTKTEQIFLALATAFGAENITIETVTNE